MAGRAARNARREPTALVAPQEVQPPPVRHAHQATRVVLKRLRAQVSAGVCYVCLRSWSLVCVRIVFA